jgi:amino acid adenylation domain-containing protein/thioester reductase-like protein
MNNNLVAKKCFLVGEDHLLIQCAEILLSHGYFISGIVSPLSEVKEWAFKNKIHYFKLFSKAKSFYTQNTFDYVFSIVNSDVIPLSMINRTTHFVINYHDSPLPRYGGVNATCWAIINNEKTHGVTWHIVNRIIDGGDILKQTTFPIEKDETALSLNLKCYQHALNLFRELVEELSNKSYTITAQDLSQRTYFGLNKKPDGNGLIKWNSKGEDIHRLFRALELGGYNNKLCSLKLNINNDIYIVDNLQLTSEASGSPPGKIVEIAEDFWKIATASINLLLLSIKTLDGEECILPDIAKHYVIDLNYCLASPSEEEYNLLSVLCSKYFKYEDFWVKKLKNLKPAEFPFLPNLSNKSFVTPSFVTVEAFMVPQTLFSTITSHIKSPQSESVALLTIWLIYLFKLGNSEGIGISLKHYVAPQEEHISKLFSTEIPFSINFTGEVSFTTCLEQVNEKINILKTKKPYLKDIIHRYQTLSRITAFIPIAVEILDDKAMKPSPVQSGSPLVLRILDNGRRLEWYIEKSLIEKNLNLLKSIHNVSHQFKTMVDSISQYLSQNIASIPLLSEREMQLILIEWNQTQKVYPKDQSICQLIEKIATENPERSAVFYEDKSLTYGELNEKANQLSHYLSNVLGVCKQDFIAVCTNRNLELLVIILGILKAQAIYVPISSNTPLERVKAIINNSNSKLLVSHYQFLEKNPTIHSNNRIKVISLDKYWPAILQQDKKNIKGNVHKNDLAYAIYTSGTTGSPKGVAIKHHSLINLAWEQLDKLNIIRESKILQFASISFDASIWEIFSTLIAGASLYIPSEKHFLIGSVLSEFINKNEITIITLPPSILQTISQFDMPSLRTIVTAGEPCSKELANHWSEKVCFINAYGPTEATVCATLGRINKKINNTLSMGKPIANTTVYVVDINLNPVPIGVTGELLIGGDGVAQGYLNQPELTEKFFIKNPFTSKNEKLYKTRDLVRWLHDGSLEYMGRIDNQIKIRGFRIEPEAIEDQILKYDHIHQCTISSRHNEKLGLFLVAYIMTEKDKIKIDDLRNFLKKTLPDYMIPSFFVFLERFPLTENGKIDRGALPAPDLCIHFNTKDYEQPRTEVEQRLAEIWSDLFSLEKVGIHDDFFSLGGNSLLLSQLILRLKDDLNIEMPFTAFINDPTIVSLSELISRKDYDNPTNRLDENIQKDLILDREITPISNNLYEKSINSVLLTGATGFLGSHLLKELFYKTNYKIYCLVRAASNDDGKKLIKKSLDNYALNVPMNDRLVPIAGNLCLPDLGLDKNCLLSLAQDIDVIYHNAAFVHHVYNYELLRSTNVSGTVEIIKLASKIKNKKIHYISTLSAAINHLADDGYIMEDFIHSNSLDNIADGYSQTKWVSEKLFSEAVDRGFCVNIYRPGWILGGVMSKDNLMINNHLYLLIKSCVQLGYAPDWDLKLNILPVDFVSKLIIEISTCTQINDNVFNLSNENAITWRSIVRYLNEFGYGVKLIPSKNWINDHLKKVGRDNALFNLLPLYLDSSRDWVHSLSKTCSAFDLNTQNAMKQINIPYPYINKELLFKCFSLLQYECLT